MRLSNVPVGSGAEPPLLRSLEVAQSEPVLIGAVDCTSGVALHLVRIELSRAAPRLVRVGRDRAASREAALRPTRIKLSRSAPSSAVLRLMRAECGRAALSKAAPCLVRIVRDRAAPRPVRLVRGHTVTRLVCVERSYTAPRLVRAYGAEKHRELDRPMDQPALKRKDGNPPVAVSLDPGHGGAGASEGREVR